MKAFLYDIKTGIKKQVELKTKPKFIEYGSTNVYEIEGIKYAQDIFKNNLYVRVEY